MAQPASSCCCTHGPTVTAGLSRRVRVRRRPQQQTQGGSSPQSLLSESKRSRGGLVHARTGAAKSVFRRLVRREPDASPSPLTLSQRHATFQALVWDGDCAGPRRAAPPQSGGGTDRQRPGPVAAQPLASSYSRPIWRPAPVSGHVPGWRAAGRPREGGRHPCLVTSPGGGQPGGPGKGAVTGSRDPGHVNASGVQAGQARVRQCVTIPRPKSTPAQVPNSDPTHTPILPVSAPHMGRARAPAAGAGKARHRPACHQRPRGSPGGRPPACS